MIKKEPKKEDKKHLKSVDDLISLINQESRSFSKGKKKIQTPEASNKEISYLKKESLVRKDLDKESVFRRIPSKQAVCPSLSYSTLKTDAFMKILTSEINIASNKWTSNDESRQVNPVLIDGSNVAFAKLDYRGRPSFQNVCRVVEDLVNKGFDPVTVYVDSNLRFIISEHRRKEDTPCILCAALEKEAYFVKGKRINVYECPGGRDGDEFILREADLIQQARIVTNDRFLEYRKQYPWLEKEGWRIKYTINNENVVLQY